MATKPGRELVKHTPQQLAKASQSLTALAALYGEGNYNLLAPTTHTEIPRGMRLAITEVSVSPEIDRYGAGDDVVKISGGKLLILKHKLDQFAAAAGVSWFEEVRRDNGIHPHYCEAFVRGRITDYDGTVREITGSKTIDVRETVPGAPGVSGKDYSEIVDKAKAKGNDPTSQLRELRKFIAEIAFSKAKNRALSSCLGIKRSYTAADLAKPFVIPKLVLDPQNPEARDLIMANAVGATAALFGAKAAAPAVIDMPYEEVETDAGEQAGETTPTVDQEPDHNPETGEVQPEEGVIPILQVAWNEAKAAQRTPGWFKALAMATVGKTDRAEMTLDDAHKIAAAVTKTITGPKAEDGDDLPC